MEDTVKHLEKRWAEIQDKALKQPLPGIFNWSACCPLYSFFKDLISMTFAVQREKMLDKQLHSLIEQLAVKQVNLTLLKSNTSTFIQTIKSN